MASKIQSLRFQQWLSSWDDLKFDAAEFRRRPSPNIYLFSMSATQLRALSGVFRRERQAGVATGIQRGHDRSRSEQIRDYVQYGYPYSEMSSTRRDSFDSDDLKKPGWLPTAIVVNILTEKDLRRGSHVAPKDLIKISDKAGKLSEITLPSDFSGGAWKPKNSLAPIEIIDGQHRLYAFDSEALPGEFELPVVAFHGLDIGWQAYLFWSINVSPKKINPSHAFDLYPLLRSQDWLEKFAESSVYREARAQELTEFLFRHPKSPWVDRINMLGERGRGGISQAAWIRSLSSTFLAAGRGSRSRGLFGCAISPTSGPLAWTRPQQAAFLIRFWEECRIAISDSSTKWAEALRREAEDEPDLLPSKLDPAFAGPNTMLNQEQGVRALMSVANDFLFRSAEALDLSEWSEDDERGEVTDNKDISDALQSLGKKKKIVAYIKEIAERGAGYDWRSANASNLSDDEKLKRRAFRGSGGYAALRDEFLKFIVSGGGAMGKLAQAIRS